MVPVRAEVEPTTTGRRWERATPNDAQNIIQLDSQLSILHSQLESNDAIARRHENQSPSAGA